jgi:hypothetical protein
MIKILVVLMLIFNILACNPIEKASQNKSIQPQIPFSCLSSQSNCELSTEVGVFTIEISGQVDKGKVKTELPFQIQLTFDAINENFQVRSVSSYLEGKSMFMGKIPVFFQAAEKNNNILFAETLLASCSDEVMTWRLWFTLEVEQENVITEQTFFIDFDSQRL